MFKYVIGTREPQPAALRRPDGLPTYDVSLIGEYNIAGEFWHVAPLFDELGLRILATLSAMAGLPKCRPCTAPRPIWWCAPRPAERGAQAARQFWHAVFEAVLRRGRHLGEAGDFARLIGDDDPSHPHRNGHCPRRSATNAALAPWRENWPASARCCTPAGEILVDCPALQDLGMTVVATGTKNPPKKIRPASAS